ncbi:insulinase family protein, partial [Xanthomonas citri pv. citri]
MVLTSFKHPTLKQFYTDWYRPDLQAVVLVGDFDVNEVEKMVKATFSSIPVKPKKAKPAITIPSHTDVKRIVVTDPEQQFNVIQVMYKQGKSSPILTDADYK